MKHIKNFILLLTLLSFSKLCFSQKIEAAKKLEKESFKILKKLDKINLENYMKYFITIEELHFLAQSPELMKDEEMRKLINATSAEMWKEISKRRYETLKESGKKHSIVWKNIKYLGCSHQLETEKDDEGIRLEFYFTHKNKSYQIDVTALWLEDKYRLVRIYRLMEKKPD